MDANRETSRRDFDSLYPELNRLPKEVREHLGLVCQKHRLWLMPQWWFRVSYVIPLILLWQLVYPQILPDNQFGEWASTSVTPTLSVIWMLTIRPTASNCKRSYIQSESILFLHYIRSCRPPYPFHLSASRALTTNLSM